MKALQDSGMQTENENAAGGGTGGGAGHNALSVFTPVTLRDVFLEQQREIRNAEDRVMQLQCSYNEEVVRIQKVREEHGSLKAEIERNNAKLIDITESTLQLQQQFQDLSTELEYLKKSKLHASSQFKLLEEECDKLKTVLITERNEFAKALEDQQSNRKDIEAYEKRCLECKLIKEFKRRAEDLLKRAQYAISS